MLTTGEALFIRDTITEVIAHCEAGEIQGFKEELEECISIIDGGVQVHSKLGDTKHG